ncbi:unnamed protein product, partial [Urochloa humidicola]
RVSAQAKPRLANLDCSVLPPEPPPPLASRADDPQGALRHPERLRRHVLLPLRPRHHRGAPRPPRWPVKVTAGIPLDSGEVMAGAGRGGVGGGAGEVAAFWEAVIWFWWHAGDEFCQDAEPTGMAIWTSPGMGATSRG